MNISKSRGDIFLTDRGTIVFYLGDLHPFDEFVIGEGLVVREGDPRCRVDQIGFKIFTDINYQPDEIKL